MIDQLGNQLLGLAEIGGNRLLGMDPKVLRLCGELQGQIIAIELTDLQQTIYCHPGSWGLRLSLQTPGKAADATIRGRLLGLINLSRQQEKVSTSIQERVEISGNASVAQKFQKILTELDIDWEEQVSRVTGDVLAHQLGNLARKTGDWLRHGRQTLEQDLGEYLQEESRVLPSRIEIENFIADVGATAMAVERLEARLQRLQQGGDRP